ncbi:MAG: phage tail assembly protein [Chloroflexota bacterium]
MMQTEYTFTLPRGYIDESGQVHQHGRMRLALSIDEVQTMSDARVQANEAYLPLVLLSRVITQLGGITVVTPPMLERMFASDMAYLQDLYLHLNSGEKLLIGAQCPSCSQRFQVQVSPLG